MILSDYISSSYEEYLALKRTKKQNLLHDLGTLEIIKNYPIASIEITEINQIDVEKFLLKIQKDRGIKYSTVNRYRSVLNAIFNYGIKEEIVNINPIRNIRRHKEYPRSVVLSKNEISRLLGNCKPSINKELYYIVSLALYTGMRFSEIIFMEKSKLKDNIYSLTAAETKSRKDREVVIHSEAMKALEEFMVLYPNSADRIFKTIYIRRSLATALKKSEITSVRFHDFRRTFATHLMESGAVLTIIQNQLGHSSIKMTEVYLSGNIKKRVDEIEKLCYKL